MGSALLRRAWWRTRTGTEVDFWSDWLAGAPGTEQWASDREGRLDATAPIRDPLVWEELERHDATAISILDVGAGPLTNLGFHHPGKELTIVPVDPLADDYDRLLRRARLEPPARTIGVAGEALLEHFGRHTFDIAYACNALDHSAEPLTIISNMVEVVKPGGAVLLRHKRNEGAAARYGGLHQWNFDVVDDDLILWNDVRRISVRQALNGRATGSAHAAGSEVVARFVTAGPGDAAAAV